MLAERGEPTRTGRSRALKPLAWRLELVSSLRQPTLTVSHHSTPPNILAAKYTLTQVTRQKDEIRGN